LVTYSGAVICCGAISKRFNSISRVLCASCIGVQTSVTKRTVIRASCIGVKRSFTKRIVIPAGMIVSVPMGEKLNIQASFNNNHYLSDALDGFVNEMSRKDRSYQISLGASFKLN
jgi:hypothetical protein